MVETPFEVFGVPTDAPLDSEALGTKDKFWFERDGGPWLFKKSRAGSGEHWAEVVASLLAQRLGLPCAQYQLAEWKGAAGVVTPRFIGVGYDLVHGNELLAERHPGYEREGARFVRTRQHTVEAVSGVIGSPDVQMPFGWAAPAGVTSPMDVFAGYLLLDAWLGNADRHHENWALVYRVSDGSRALSPTFDHASSLGAHETDRVRSARLSSPDPGYRVEAYVSRAIVRSPFFATTSETAGLSPLRAFRLWAERATAAPWTARLGALTSGDVAELLAGLPSAVISGPSRAFAAAILRANRERILGME